MDSTLSPEPAMDADNDDIAVPIETLAVDGTRPQVGDQVTLKVGGTVAKIVNDNAWVTPETVNDQPIPGDAEEPPSDDMANLAQASAGAGPIGGGY